MKKVIILLFLCCCVAGAAACGTKTSEEVQNRGTEESSGANTAKDDTELTKETEIPEMTVQESEASEGNKETEIPETAVEESETSESDVETEIPKEAEENTEIAEESLYERFYKEFYSGMSEEEMLGRIDAVAYQSSKYYHDIVEYWELTRGVTDISNYIDPLYYTNYKYYSKEDFQNDPPVVIHLAKNEIYARHGYIFQDEDLNNYFKGCAWYQPVCTGEEFDDAVFNDYERRNLEILSELDQ